MQIRKSLFSLFALGSALVAPARAQLADLVIPSFRVSSTTFTAGSTVTADLVIRNNGLSRAGACKLRFTIYWGLVAEHRVVTVAVPAISARRSWATTQSLRIPVDLRRAGAAQMVAWVDSDQTVPELSNTNNFAQIDGVSVQRSDLRLENLQSTTRRWLRGRSYAFSVTVKNAGALPTRSVEIELYLSRDARITPSDTPLARASFAPLAAGATRSQLFQVTLPSSWPLGVCAIGYYVDPRNVEVEALENNNALGLGGVCAVEGTYGSFGAGCAATGRGRVTQSGIGVPKVGDDAVLRLTNAVPGRPVALLLGGSNTRWNGVPLPLDLGPFGAVGCWLAVRPDASLPTAADPRGQATVRLPLPASLAGMQFYSQFVVTGARNRLTVATSNGLVTRIGS